MICVHFGVPLSLTHLVFRKNFLFLKLHHSRPVSYGATVCLWYTDAVKTITPYTQSLLRTTGISIWILFALSYLAIRFNIYYTFTWFDTLMHFLGGAVSALVVYSILMRLRVQLPSRTVSFFWLLVVCVIGVGFAWEVVEYVVNYYIPTYTFDPLDTTIDIIADTVGAMGATAFIMKHKKRHTYGN